MSYFNNFNRQNGFEFQTIFGNNPRPNFSFDMINELIPGLNITGISIPPRRQNMDDYKLNFRPPANRLPSRTIRLDTADSDEKKAENRKQRELEISKPENQELAKKEILTWFKGEDIPQKLLRYMMIRRIKSESKSFPTLSQIVLHALEYACSCMTEFPTNELIGCVRHFFITYGTPPTCIQTRAALEFYHLHNTWPTNEQLLFTVERLREFTFDFNSLYHDDKKDCPTPNLDELKPQKLNDNKENYCAICQEPINSGQDIYELKPCNHVFHSNSSQCLGSHTILNWLEKNDKCPVCKSVVIIENDKSKTS